MARTGFAAVHVARKSSLLHSYSADAESGTTTGTAVLNAGQRFSSKPGLNGRLIGLRTSLQGWYLARVTVLCATRSSRMRSTTGLRYLGAAAPPIQSNSVKQLGAAEGGLGVSVARSSSPSIRMRSSAATATYAKSVISRATLRCGEPSTTAHQKSTIVSRLLLTDRIPKQTRKQRIAVAIIERRLAQCPPNSSATPDRALF